MGESDEPKKTALAQASEEAMVVDTMGGRVHVRWDKAAEKCVATVPQVFDLRQDPQERYDLFMTNWTERTWTMVPIGAAVEKLMKTCPQYPPRKLQSIGYDGPLELSKYQKFQ
jgi:hypothetical protein